MINFFVSVWAELLEIGWWFWGHLEELSYIATILGCWQIWLGIQHFRKIQRAENQKAVIWFEKHIAKQLNKSVDYFEVLCNEHRSQKTYEKDFVRSGLYSGLCNYWEMAQYHDANGATIGKVRDMTMKVRGRLNIVSKNADLKDAKLKNLI
jgi:hypothetical protein